MVKSVSNNQPLSGGWLLKVAARRQSREKRAKVLSVWSLLPSKEKNKSASYIWWFWPKILKKGFIIILIILIIIYSTPSRSWLRKATWRSQRRGKSAKPLSACPTLWNEPEFPKFQISKNTPITRTDSEPKFCTFQTWNLIFFLLKTWHHKMPNRCKIIF